MRGKRQSLRRYLMSTLFVLLLLSGCQLVQAPTVSSTKLKPRVIVHDQPIVAGQITVAEVATPQAGWIVIRRSQAGNLDAVVGLASVSAGINTNVTVEIDLALATTTLYALLHSDAGERGVYEFPGADAPIIVSNPPMLAFAVTDLPSTSGSPTDERTTPSQPAQGVSAVDELRVNEPRAFGLYLPLVAHTVTLEGIVTQSANLRAGPDLTFPVVGGARARQRIALIACNETCTWYQLANGTWIAAFLVQDVVAAAALLPRITAP